jgi:hypothetical protein
MIVGVGRIRKASQIRTPVAIGETLLVMVVLMVCSRRMLKAARSSARQLILAPVSHSAMKMVGAVLAKRIRSTASKIAMDRRFGSRVVLTQPRQRQAQMSVGHLRMT